MLEKQFKSVAPKAELMTVTGDNRNSGGPIIVSLQASTG